MSSPIDNSYPELQSALTALATLLGAPFEPPKPLQPIAGSSNPIIQQQQQQRNSLGRVVSNSSFKPEKAGTKKRSLLGPLDGDEQRDVWLDLGGQVLESLEADLKRAIEERVSSSALPEVELRGLSLRSRTIVEDSLSRRLSTSVGCITN